MKRKDWTELRRAARLYRRSVQTLYEASEANWSTLHRLSNAIDTAARETDGPVSEMFKASALTIPDSHATAYKGASEGRDRIRQLCELLGVR